MKLSFLYRHTLVDTREELIYHYENVLTSDRNQSQSSLSKEGNFSAHLIGESGVELTLSLVTSKVQIVSKGGPLSFITVV